SSDSARGEREIGRRGRRGRRGWGWRRREITLGQATVVVVVVVVVVDVDVDALRGRDRERSCGGHERDGVVPAAFVGRSRPRGTTTTASTPEHKPRGPSPNLCALCA